MVIISCVQAYLIMSGQHLSVLPAGEAVCLAPNRLWRVSPGRIYCLNPEEVLLVETFSDTYSMVSALGQADYAGAEWFAVELIQHREFAPGILFKFDYQCPKLLTSLLPMFMRRTFLCQHRWYLCPEMGPYNYQHSRTAGVAISTRSVWHVFAAVANLATPWRSGGRLARFCYSVAAGVYDIAAGAAAVDWESEEIDFAHWCALYLVQKLLKAMEQSTPTG